MPGRPRNASDPASVPWEMRLKPVHLAIVMSWALAGIGIGLVQVALTGFAAEWQVAGPAGQTQFFRIHQAIYVELYAGVALVLAGLQAAAITSFCSLSPTPWRSILLRAVVFGPALSALAVEASSAVDLPDCLNREKNFCVLHSPASEAFATAAAVLVSQALSAFGLLAALPVATAVMKRRADRHDG